MTENIPDSPYVVWDPKGFEEELTLLLAASTTKTYGGGKIVYLQGEKSDAFFFVRKGRIKISILKEDGSETTIRIQESNTFFGEYAAFDGHPHFATAVAVEKSEISRLPLVAVESVIEAHPKVAFLIINRIIRKFRSLAFQVEDLAFLDAQHRIAHILMSLATEVGEQDAQGITIRKGMTHEDIAHLTGLSRVRVTTILNNLDRANIIRKKRGSLTIIDPAKLRNLLNRIPDL
jgi:CRP/FNR family transcriptional regulator